MMNKLPEAEWIRPAWSCIVCVLRNESTRSSGVQLSMVPGDPLDYRWVLTFDDFELHTFHASCCDLK